MRLRTYRDITKDDIMKLCELVNDDIEFNSICEFDINNDSCNDGRILYKYIKTNSYSDSFEVDKRWNRKMLKFLKVGNCGWNTNWPVFTNKEDWIGNNDIVCRNKQLIDIHFDSYYEAQKFTSKEINIWYKALQTLGLKKTKCSCWVINPKKAIRELEDYKLNRLL